MADITYCINTGCPFKDCDRHDSKASQAAVDGRGYVSIADYSGVCRRYISHLVDEIRKEEDRASGTKK